MASVFDLAKYILSITDKITTMKLQKLVYYSQAWSVTLNDEPIFDEPIRAWSDGPVVRELFLLHKGQWDIDFGSLSIGDPEVLTPQQKDIVDRVIEKYGDLDAEDLSLKTHQEDPWKHAADIISEYAMKNYYKNEEPVTKIQITDDVKAWAKSLSLSAT